MGSRSADQRCHQSDCRQPPVIVAVGSRDPGLAGVASALAVELGLPRREPDQLADVTAWLEVGAQGLQLIPMGKSAPGPIRVDFGSGALRHRRRGGHNEAIGRAVGIGKRDKLRIVDGTAGLGRDSFVLADLGCEVCMLERSPVVFALLRDGLARARDAADSWLRDTAARLSLKRGDAREGLLAAGLQADVVYLDPMLPARRKSARVKKEMWIFHQLLGPDPAPAELLSAALAAASWRVVVKRPGRSPVLAGPPPHHEIAGKTVRFDVYNCA